MAVTTAIINNVSVPGNGRLDVTSNLQTQLGAAAIQPARLHILVAEGGVVIRGDLNGATRYRLSYMVDWEVNVGTDPVTGLPKTIIELVNYGSAARVVTAIVTQY